jgi:hypothetical protein
VHTLAVPAGYDLYVEVTPADSLDVEIVVFAGGEVQHHRFAGVGQPEWLRVFRQPVDGEARVEVRAVGGTAGTYELRIH